MGTAATVERQEVAGEAVGQGTYLLPGYCLSWTTRPGARTPSDEARTRAIALVERLDRSARLRERVDVRLLATPAALAEGDIGLLETPGANGSEPAVTLLLREGRSLSRRVAIALPWSEVERRLTRLLRNYMVEGCGLDTFGSWTGNLTDDELRERLGLPAVTESTATA